MNESYSYYLDFLNNLALEIHCWLVGGVLASWRFPLNRAAFYVPIIRPIVILEKDKRINTLLIYSQLGTEAAHRQHA